MSTEKLELYQIEKDSITGIEIKIAENYPIKFKGVDVEYGIISTSKTLKLENPNNVIMREVLRRIYRNLENPYDASITIEIQAGERVLTGKFEILGKRGDSSSQWQYMINEGDNELYVGKVGRYLKYKTANGKRVENAKGEYTVTGVGNADLDLHKVSKALLTNVIPALRAARASTGMLKADIITALADLADELAVAVAAKNWNDVKVLSDSMEELKEKIS